MDRIEAQVGFDNLAPMLRAYFHSITSEKAACALMVIDDERRIFRPDSDWIATATLLVETSLDAGLLQRSGDKLVCSPVLEKLIRVRQMLEAVRLALSQDNGCIAQLLAACEHNAMLRDASGMMAFLLT